MKTKMLITFET